MAESSKGSNHFHTLDSLIAQTLEAGHYAPAAELQEIRAAAEVRVRMSVAIARLLLLEAEGKATVDGREYRYDVQAEFPMREVKPEDVRISTDPAALEIWRDQHICIFDIIPMEDLA